MKFQEPLPFNSSTLTKLSRRFSFSAAISVSGAIGGMSCASGERKMPIIHTDQSSQYAAVEYRRLLYIGGFRQLMSRKGNCYDNAQAESFFSRLKAELLENGIFESVEDARSEVFGYIEGYDNRIRLHSGLGYKSPLQLENELKIENIKSKESFVS